MPIYQTSPLAAFFIQARLTHLIAPGLQGNPHFRGVLTPSLSDRSLLLGSLLDLLFSRHRLNRLLFSLTCLPLLLLRNKQALLFPLYVGEVDSRGVEVDKHLVGSLETTLWMHKDQGVITQVQQGLGEFLLGYCILE